jgi:hypothetical protein
MYISVYMGMNQATRVDAPANAPEASLRKRTGRLSRMLGKCRDFALMLPLAASLALGSGCKSECSSHNETTIPIVKETDGKSISMKELESIKPSWPLQEELLDFIRETHALSTEGIPADTTLTLLPAVCSPKKEAIAFIADDPRSDRGIYLHPVSLLSKPVNLKDKIAHEIGHLMGGNHHTNEVISQLNQHEQALMGFVLLQKQSYPTEDLVRYLAMLDAYYLGMNIILKLDYLRGGSMGFDDLSKYDHADFMIFKRLIEGAGFSAMRASFGGLSKKQKLSSTAASETSSYIDSNLEEPISETLIKLRLAHLSELSDRFGPAMSQSFFKVSSALLSLAPVRGLGGMSCAENALPGPPPQGESCLDELTDENCWRYNSQKKAAIAPKLCCLEIQPDGSYSKYAVSASGMMYFHYLDQIDFLGYRWSGIRFLQIDSKEKLALDEPCR